MACNGLKKASFHLFVHPKRSRIIFRKTHFYSIFDEFLVVKQPILKAFGTFEGPKWLAMGSKRAHFTCLGTPDGLGSFLEKHIFDPFSPLERPIFKPFCDHCGAKVASNGLKTGSFHLLVHPP